MAETLPTTTAYCTTEGIAARVISLDCNFMAATTETVDKPTGYVMRQQFNIQQLYALSALYLCVLFLSENKQRLVPLTP